MKTSIALLSGLLLAGTGAAMAAPATDNHFQQDQGFYIGAQWLPAQESLGNGKPEGQFYALAGGLNAGYQFNRYVAVEAGVQGLYEHDSFNFGDGFKGSDTDEIIFPSVAVKGILPVGSRVDFYGKAGAAVGILHISGKAEFGNFGNGTASDTGYQFAPFAGVGMGVYMTHHLEFTVDQTMYYLTQSKAGYGFSGIGLAYHF